MIRVYPSYATVDDVIGEMYVCPTGNPPVDVPREDFEVTFLKHVPDLWNALIDLLHANAVYPSHPTQFKCGMFSCDNDKAVPRELKTHVRASLVNSMPAITHRILDERQLHYGDNIMAIHGLWSCECRSSDQPTRLMAVVQPAPICDLEAFISNFPTVSDPVTQADRNAVRVFYKTLESVVGQVVLGVIRALASSTCSMSVGGFDDLSGIAVLDPVNILDQKYDTWEYAVESPVGTDWYPIPMVDAPIVQMSSLNAEGISTTSERRDLISFATALRRALHKREKKPFRCSQAVRFCEMLIHMSAGMYSMGTQFVPFQPNKATDEMSIPGAPIRYAVALASRKHKTHFDLEAHGLSAFLFAARYLAPFKPNRLPLSDDHKGVRRFHCMPHTLFQGEPHREPIEPRLPTPPPVFILPGTDPSKTQGEKRKVKKRKTDVPREVVDLTQPSRPLLTFPPTLYFSAGRPVVTSSAHYIIVVPAKRASAPVALNALFPSPRVAPPRPSTAAVRAARTLMQLSMEMNAVESVPLEETSTDTTSVRRGVVRISDGGRVKAFRVA